MSWENEQLWAQKPYLPFWSVSSSMQSYSSSAVKKNSGSIGYEKNKIAQLENVYWKDEWPVHKQSIAHKFVSILVVVVTHSLCPLYAFHLSDSNMKSDWGESSHSSGSIFLFSRVEIRPYGDHTCIYFPTQNCNPSTLNTINLTGHLWSWINRDGMAMHNEGRCFKIQTSDKWSTPSQSRMAASVLITSIMLQNRDWEPSAQSPVTAQSQHTGVLEETVRVHQHRQNQARGSGRCCDT